MEATNNKQTLVKQLLPFVLGIILILAFARLGIWQLDRAQQKIAIQQAFDRPPRYEMVFKDMRAQPFQAIEARGRYLGGQQILIENAILNGALGYYVITPFEFDRDGPLLLVNRGWVGRNRDAAVLPAIAVAEAAHRIRGKSGHLPRVGIRPGEAFIDHSRWPRLGVWPTTDEVSAELGRDVLPFVLLLDPDADDGFERHWQPQQSGASTHYSYAFQWFAMALAVLVLMVRSIRKRMTNNDP